GKAAKGRDLDHLAALQRAGNLGDHRFDKFGRLVAGEANLLINRFGELRSGNRMARHDALPLLLRTLARPKIFVKLPSVAEHLSRHHYHRTTLAPQVRPPPSASISTRWPGRMRPSATASSSASGIEAAEVLAWRSIVTTVLSRGRPSLRPTASMIRVFAWCGTSQSISLGSRPLAANASSTTSLRCCTACRNTSRPSIRRQPAVPVEEGPPSTYRMSCWRPSE